MVINVVARTAGIDAVVDGLSGLDEDFEDEWAAGTPLDYGRHLETGTSRMPPYPWLGPAARHVLGSQLEDAVREIDAAEETIEVITKRVADQARRNVQAGSAGRRSPGTEPSHPGVVTGDLLDSIEAVQL